MLTAYISDEDKFLHVGIIEPPARVISKFGILPVFSHPIEQISGAYRSTSYLCFKKVREPVYLEVKGLLDSAEKGISDLSHPACHSPFSSLGDLLELRKKLIEIVLKRQLLTAQGCKLATDYC